MALFCPCPSSRDQRGDEFGHAAIDAKAAGGFTALMAAAMKGHLDVVKCLADERGAAIDAKAADGSTALIAAAGGCAHQPRQA